MDCSSTEGEERGGRKGEERGEGRKGMGEEGEKERGRGREEERKEGGGRRRVCERTQRHMYLQWISLGHYHKLDNPSTKSSKRIVLQ